MPSHNTPGVYIEETNAFRPSIISVETAIPAFIGYTEKAERDSISLSLVPTLISSILEYETLFGSAPPEDTITITLEDSHVTGNLERTITVSPPSPAAPFLMFYSLQLYFANGGGPCYIVSVAQYGTLLAAPASLVNKSDLDRGLDEIAKVSEPTLLLFPDATNLNNTEDFYALYNDALSQCAQLQDRFTLIDTKTDDAVNETPIKDLRNKITSDTTHLKYGAAYYPFLETILNYQYDEAIISITHSTDQAEANENRGTYHGLTLEALAGMDLHAYNEIKAAIANVPLKLPPSAAVAGIFKKVDTDRGVWKAPANISLNYVIKPSLQISDLEQGGLNVDSVSGKSINAIRTFSGRGTLIWGGKNFSGK